MRIWQKWCRSDGTKIVRMHEIIGYIFFSPQEDDVRYPGPRGGGGGEGNGRELGQRNQVKQVYTLYSTSGNGRIQACGQLNPLRNVMILCSISWMNTHLFCLLQLSRQFSFSFLPVSIPPHLTLPLYLFALYLLLANCHSCSISSSSLSLPGSLSHSFPLSLSPPLI